LNDETRKPQSKLLDWINQSGFPLQIALAQQVAGTRTERGWKVKYTEHAWKNPKDGHEGFIDIVLEDASGAGALVLECKRALDSSWAFLLPDPKQASRRHVKVWLTWSGGRKSRHFGWHDITLSPSTPQSQFCVVRGQDPRSVPMLERIAADLVSATEALAAEESPYLNQSPENLRAYVSIIVTTATLHVVQFDPASISLDTGKIPDGQASEVPAVRFRKQLSVHAPDLETGHQGDSHAVSLAKEHTVFIVNAVRFMDFLEQFEFDENAFRFLA